MMERGLQRKCLSCHLMEMLGAGKIKVAKPRKTARKAGPCNRDNLVKETQEKMEFEKPESGPTNLCLASIHSNE